MPPAGTGVEAGRCCGMDADQDQPTSAAGEGLPTDDRPAPEGVGISLMITKRQKASLHERGFSDEAIREMTPAEAHKHLGV